MWNTNHVDQGYTVQILCNQADTQRHLHWRVCLWAKKINMVAATAWLMTYHFLNTQCYKKGGKASVMVARLPSWLFDLWKHLQHYSILTEHQHNTIENSLLVPFSSVQPAMLPCQDDNNQTWEPISLCCFLSFFQYSLCCGLFFTFPPLGLELLLAEW